MRRVGANCKDPAVVERLAAAKGISSEALEAGHRTASEDARAHFERVGVAVREAIVSRLPAEWSFEGKRVLDFGCGAGRVLRQFLPEAGSAEFWGCDIDQPSIGWMRDHLSPPLRVFANEESPPLPHPDGHFDLVYTLSVFTHLTDSWSSWLLELHRVLANGGLLIATFINHGFGFSGSVIKAPWHEAWDDDRIGMGVLHPEQSWDMGGPTVYHSEWWLRAHWGRAFEILVLDPAGFASPDPGFGQGVAVMRKRSVPLTVADLEALEPDEPREVAALQYSLRQSRRETVWVRERAQGSSPGAKAKQRRLASRLKVSGRRNARLARKLKACRRQLHRARKREQALRQSLSWRLTAPLRLVTAGVRALRRR